MFKQRRNLVYVYVLASTQTERMNWRCLLRETEVHPQFEALFFDDLGEPRTFRNLRQKSVAAKRIAQSNTFCQFLARDAKFQDFVRSTGSSRVLFHIESFLADCQFQCAEAFRFLATRSVAWKTALKFS